MLARYTGATMNAGVIYSISNISKQLLDEGFDRSDLKAANVDTK